METEQNNNKQQPIEATVTAENQIEEADQLFSMGQYQKAANIYQKIIDEYPMLCRIYRKIGMCHYQLQDLDQAEVFWNSAFQCEIDR